MVRKVGTFPAFAYSACFGNTANILQRIEEGTA